MLGLVPNDCIQIVSFQKSKEIYSPKWSKTKKNYDCCKMQNPSQRIGLQRGEGGGGGGGKSKNSHLFSSRCLTVELERKTKQIQPGAKMVKNQFEKSWN